MLKSTRHNLKNLNKGKLKVYLKFLAEYKMVCQDMIDFIWSSLPSDFKIKDYIDYKIFKTKTNLSSRALSSALNQAYSIVKSSIELERRRLWLIKNKNVSIKSIKFSKPKIKAIVPELSSKCCDIIQTPNSKFWGFVRIKAIGDEYGHIKIPIEKSPAMDEQPLSGVRFFEDKIQLAWKVKTSSIDGSVVLGADQGIKTVLSLSDGQTTPVKCKHNHSLASIIDKIKSKKKGSKAQKKALDHRKNFVNWSINQLNFSNAKEVRLEKISPSLFSSKLSSKTIYWSNSEIRDKVKRRCEELEVPVIEQSCAYRSQRCSQCGQVRKANRKGKTYECKNCGFVCDADTNAAMNHSQELFPIPFGFLKERKNLGNGFFWSQSEIFLSDRELRVPDSTETPLGELNGSYFNLSF